METILMLLVTLTFGGFLIARPFIKGTYRTHLVSNDTHFVRENYIDIHQGQMPKSWKFDPHEEKILQHLLVHLETGISVSELNTLLKVQEKSSENQRQRRHLVIKELNTKLFVLFNIRECIVRIPEESDFRKKQYVLKVGASVYKELNSFLPI